MEVSSWMDGWMDGCWAASKENDRTEAILQLNTISHCKLGSSRASFGLFQLVQAVEIETKIQYSETSLRVVST